MIPRYLTVDLILRSRENLSPIADFLGDRVFLLWNETLHDIKSLGIETTLDFSKGPEDDLVEILRLLKTLTPELIDLFDRCSERIVDIGFESGSSGDPIDATIRAGIVEELAKFQIAINIRVYAVPPPSVMPSS